jgi:hypothetical protein
MSYNVLVVTEDFTKDAAVVVPVVEKVLMEVGKPRALVRACTEPNFGGISEAMRFERLRDEVIGEYPSVHLFVLLFDRDGQDGQQGRKNRDEAAAFLENRLKELLQAPRRSVVTLAWQEVEAFVLAGHDLAEGWSWRDIRADSDVKNTYFKQLVNLKGTARYPHEGRKTLMAEAIKNWARIKSRCPEDIGALIAKLGPSLAAASE